MRKVTRAWSAARITAMSDALLERRHLVNIQDSNPILQSTLLKFNH
jgi:hypothetical protein